MAWIYNNPARTGDVQPHPSLRHPRMAWIYNTSAQAGLARMYVAQ